MKSRKGSRNAHVDLRLFLGGSVRLARRALWAGAIMALACLLVSGFGLFTGTYHISVARVLDVLGGGGNTTEHFIVIDQRMARLCAALLVGASLGLAGSLFQTLSRNPLGSPDIIGFTTGSTTGALTILLVAGGNAALGVGGGAVLGGLATAALVQVVSSARGAAGGNRLVITGIAVGAMLASLNDYLIIQADVEAAESAKTWTFGSLNAITWDQVRPAAVSFPLLFGLTVLIARPLRMMEMGDDAAASLGIRVERVRLAALTVGVALTGTAIAVTGPIGFLALAAPQLARRAGRVPGIPVATAALTGALLLCAADFLAQRLLEPFQIPVGLVTGALGGLYLMWLLWRQKA
ncbi:FecCD family ABC transporter permease [Streptomyces sp. 8L]|uniref:FecCD family ABC transporter permease n=1 Tax=Streptomyces sp. 8L TaxID=2877242 RepID=UPI001CD81074|nr:iron chelate uptake ABC transporter family permease subunit [Streptomyces sp. 8L]MCA1219433.1 iron chelate uptake ABC transporter family permease subunit [Streptomyces sp. 8L]